MSLQTIDEFAKNLSPSVKKALTDASVARSAGLSDCAAADEPDVGWV